jgi:2-oxoglutarate dehydrogenase E2 component (dihydrolipoamide succinyltransferase)
MSRMRLRIAERMKEAQSTAASLTTFNEVDMHCIMALRAKYKDAFTKKHSSKDGGDVRLGLMSPFVMAAARALQEFPVVNASVAPDGRSIHYHGSVDISVAVATPKVGRRACMPPCRAW